MEKAEYYPKVKGYVKSKVTHHQDAEDLTQHVFMEYYHNKRESERKSRLKRTLKMQSVLQEEPKTG